MKRQQLKHKLKETLAIVFLWLLVISILYIIYLKIKLFHY